jgi:hypothetical protein
MDQYPISLVNQLKGRTNMVRNPAPRVFVAVIAFVLLPIMLLSQSGERQVLSGTRLGAGFNMGVDTSEQQRAWVKKWNDGECFQLSYPKGQSWGAMFITAGQPVPPGSRRVSFDFSAFQTLAVEMKAESNGALIDIGIKSIDQPDDGTETKVTKTLTTEWKTYEIPLNQFTGTDLKRVYVATEFVFGSSDPEIVYVRSVRYLTRPAQN